MNQNTNNTYNSNILDIKITHEHLEYFRLNFSSYAIDYDIVLNKLVQLNKLHDNDDHIKTELKANIIIDFTKIITPETNLNDTIDTSLNNIEQKYTIVVELIELIKNHQLTNLNIYAIAADSDATILNAKIFEKYNYSIPILQIPFDNNGLLQTTNFDTLVKKTLIITQPVRNGVTIIHDGDISIYNLVSDNAEIISSGNIHIYDVAKGRLIAGSSGDKSARIFAHKFNPESISIAGVSRNLEHKLPDSVLNKPAVVYLDERNKLNIVAI